MSAFANLLQPFNNHALARLEPVLDYPQITTPLADTNWSVDRLSPS